MPFKKDEPEEIIGKLREIEIVLAQGASTAEACRRIAMESHLARLFEDVRAALKFGVSHLYIQ